MKLTNTFVVAAPIDTVWPALIDLQRVGKCLPGATLEPDGEGAFRGRMRVKLGPINTSYEGQVRLLDVDVDERRASIEVIARDTNGNGSASALIVNGVSSDGNGSTRVASTTELKIVGRVAQLGRGVIEDVSAAMLDDFSKRLTSELTTASEATLPTGEARPSATPTETQLDAFDAGPMLRRAAGPRATAVGLAAGLILLTAIIWRPRGQIKISIDITL